MDTLGDRMKLYEDVEAQRRLMPLLPVMVRLDGRAFHTFTKGLQRPYDPGMSMLMVETTRYLVAEVGACIGYTQSDEISLVLQQSGFDQQIVFDGRTQKMCSQLAAMASVYFNQRLVEYLPSKVGQGRAPTFDCRVWNVPTRDEAVNTILWRERDATKNSVSMAASQYFSHKELHGKHRNDMLDMLHAKGINWNTYPAFFKRGTFVQKVIKSRPFTTEELTKLPPKHNAHLDPNLMISRTDYVEIDMPPFDKVSNKMEVIFYGEQPHMLLEERHDSE